MEFKDSWSTLGVTEWLTGHTSIAVVKRHKKKSSELYSPYTGNGFTANQSNVTNMWIPSHLGVYFHKFS
jgi:hypothetical protein